MLYTLYFILYPQLDETSAAEVRELRRELSCAQDEQQRSQRLLAQAQPASLMRRRLIWVGGIFLSDLLCLVL